MDEWQLKAEKSAEIRSAIGTAMDRMEQEFQKRLAEERKAFIDEAEKIAMEIIRKELEKEKKPAIEAIPNSDANDDLFTEDIIRQKKGNEAEKPETRGLAALENEAPKKQHVEFSQENIKIIKQLAEIKKRDVEEKRKTMAKNLELEREQKRKFEEGKKKVEAAWKEVEEKEWTGTFD